MSFIRKLLSWIKQEDKCTDDEHAFKYRFLGAQRGWSLRPVPHTPCQCGAYASYDEYHHDRFMLRVITRFGRSLTEEKRAELCKAYKREVNHG